MAKLVSPDNVLATTFSVDVAAVCALAMAVSIWPLLTAESAAVPSAIPFTSLPPALIPSVVMEIAEAPVPLGVMVTPSPLITVVLPPAVVKVADVKPLNTFARRMFNVPAPSDTTPMLPVAKSAAFVTPPLMDNTSPCLRTDVVPVSPSNLCSASAKACVVLAFALVTASLIAVATFCVVATPLEPAAPDAPVVPAAPTCPLAATTKLPVFTSTVYVLTPPTVLSDTVARPVPATFTASCAAPLAKFLITVSPLEEILDKFLFAAFSAAATASVNLDVGAMVTSSTLADVVINALVPVCPLMLNLTSPEANFLAVVDPVDPPREIVRLTAVDESVIDCFVVVFKS